VALLVATALFGITKKGATRWLNVGVVIQPSEILKIATPLMLAWWFQKREARCVALARLCRGRRAAAGAGGAGGQAARPGHIAAGGCRRPVRDLLCRTVVAADRRCWCWCRRWALVAHGRRGDALCQPGVDWPVLRDYQQHRVCTLLDPTRDPLGKGFHIIQGMIAIGSGGLTGKGFMSGTQTHLEFIPERTTDFIFAAFSEEFGLAGVLPC
jgi:rod shape determining protein RodA